MLLTLPLPAIGVGLAATPLWALYPLAKRVTDWPQVRALRSLAHSCRLTTPGAPQVVLGLAFNWGAILGWVAVHSDVHWPVVAPLYASCILWTLHYDTIYAHQVRRPPPAAASRRRPARARARCNRRDRSQDKRDDVHAGVRSTALRLGDRTGVFLAACSGGTLVGLGIAGAGLHPTFYLALAAAGGHLAWQVRTVDLADRADCLRKFQSNRDVGAIVFAGVLLGKVCAG